eukprot:766645-Hanusia_phi.AAC.6
MTDDLSDDNTGQTKGDMYSFDTSSKTWAEVTQTGYRPSSRYGQAMVAVGTDIYLFGGSTTYLSGEPLSNSLGSCPVLPYRLPYGSDTFMAAAESTLHKFDSQTSRWDAVTTSGAAVPQRFGHAMVAVGSLVYLFGGSNNALNGDGEAQLSLTSDVPC